MLGLVNALVRPVTFLLTLPLTIVTLGLFIFVLNAAMFGLVAAFLDDFVVAGFWSAVFGAIVVGITGTGGAGKSSAAYATPPAGARGRTKKENERVPEEYRTCQPTMTE